MPTIDRATPASVPFPSGTTEITFSIHSIFPALAAGAVALWELRGDGHSVVGAPRGVDTDPQTPEGNSASWQIDPAKKYLVWFAGAANMIQPGGTIILSATVKNQNGTVIATLSNSDSPATEASTVNFSFYLG